MDWEPDPSGGPPPEAVGYGFDLSAIRPKQSYRWVEIGEEYAEGDLVTHLTADYGLAARPVSSSAVMTRKTLQESAWPAMRKRKSCQQNAPETEP